MIEAVHVRYLKSLLYSDDPEKLEQLKEKIRQVIALIWVELENYLKKSTIAEGPEVVIC